MILSALISPKTALLSFVIAALAVLPAYGQGGRLQLPNLDRLAAEASETVDITLDEEMMKFAAAFVGNDADGQGPDSDDEKVKKLLQGLKGVYVKSFTFEKDGAYTPADVESLRTQLRAPGWTKMVDVKSKQGEDVEVFALLQGGTISGLAVIAMEPKELTIVNIVGTIDPQVIRDLDGRFGIPPNTLRRKDQPEQQKKP
jgi:hypothetical protein